MTKIVKCVVCSKIKKIYSPTAQFFICCSVRQKIDATNWINRPLDNLGLPAITPNSKSSAIKPMNKTSTPSVSEKDISSISDTSVFDANAEVLEIEQEEQETRSKNPQDYNFQCGSCKAMFNEHDGRCPNPSCDKEFDTPTKKGEEK